MHLVGTTIRGKYRIEKVLGEGGMGVVVAAHHLALDQKVAIKFLLPSTLEHKSFVDRFAREARAAARIQSDHVARVLDVDTLDDGTPFMVMEMLEGADLSRVRELGAPLPAHVAVAYLLEACEAVAEAHRVGIVHRDLKPANLFLSRRADGRVRVKVLDFGISKIAGAAGEVSVTATSAIMGSAEYMSPEQMVSTKNADVRSDIWALGVCLYELLTACVPFEGDTVTAVCALVLQTHPRSLLERRPDVSPELNAVVFRCLEKDPARRFQDVASFTEALRSLTFGPHDALVGGPRLSSPSFSGPTISGSGQITFGGSGPASQAITQAQLSGGSSPNVSSPSHPHWAPIGGTQGAFSTSPERAPKKISNSTIFLVGGIGTALVLGAAVIFAVILKHKPISKTSESALATSAQASHADPVTSPSAKPVEAVPAPEVVPSPSAVASATSSASAAASSSAETPPTQTSKPSHVGKTPKAHVDCNPPFTLDANGIKHAKPQCL